MRKSWSLKIKEVKNSKKNKPLNITKVGSQTLKKFFVCCFVIIKVPR
jgi:hypothetical protein